MDVRPKYAFDFRRRRVLLLSVLQRFKRPYYFLLVLLPFFNIV